MLVEIDRGVNSPLYLQIHQQIRELILSGALPEQTRLPPTRDLARALDINRTTVVNAYRRLWSEGLIEGRSGGGTIVAPYESRMAQQKAVPVHTHQPLAWEALYTEHVPLAGKGLSQQAIPESSDGAITFALGGGTGDVCSQMGAQEVLARPLLEGEALLGSPPPQGDGKLRRLISEHLELDGIRATPSQILIMSSLEQGVYVVAQALLNHGDGVAIISPTCPSTLHTLRSSGARLHLVPTDSEGVRLDVMEGILSHLHPKLIVVEPTFHNPTGTTLSLDRRRRLLELAYKYRVPVLELDAYAQIRYGGQSLPSLKALDRQNHVLYLSTAGQLLPGLRVGWLVAPQRVARQVAALKHSIELCTPGLAQAMACAFIPWLDENLSEIVEQYQTRRDAMCEGLERHCHGLVRWVRPEGGFFIWGELQRGLFAKALLDEALREGVGFTPGPSFFPEGRGGERYLRLNFAAAPEPRIALGLERLGRAVRSTLAVGTKEAKAVRRVKRALGEHTVPAVDVATASLLWEGGGRMK